MTSSRIPKLYAAGLGLAALGLVLAVTALDPAGASINAANKMAVRGGTIEIMSAPLTEGASSEVHTLLAGTIKTSSPTDVIIQVTAECALWTGIATVGDDLSEAVASVKVWVEVDGVPVKVSSDDTEDPGRVTFCNRAYKMETVNFDDDDAEIRQYLSTRTANSFNWIATNLGSAPSPHTITVKGQIDSEVTGTGEAYAAIGKRTLVVEPVKLATDIVV